MSPRLSRSTKALLATLPLTFSLSTRTETVMTLQVGISLRSLVFASLSRYGALLDFSLVFPLDHFFFLALPPEEPDEPAGALFT